MPLSQKSRSKTSALVKSARGERGKRKFSGYPLELPRTAAKKFMVAMPPPGVKITFVAKTLAAKRMLANWASRPPTRVGRVVASDPARPVKTKANIESPASALGSRARALLRGREIAEADLKEAGGAFTAEEAQKLLNGVTRQALEKRVRDGSVLAVPGPSNRRRYPAMQFTHEGVVPGLAAVQQALPTRNPWTILNFLIRPDDRLGGRKPIEVLLDGDVELAVSAARGMGVQGG